MGISTELPADYFQGLGDDGEVGGEEALGAGAGSVPGTGDVVWTAGAAVALVAHGHEHQRDYEGSVPDGGGDGGGVFGRQPFTSGDSVSGSGIGIAGEVPLGTAGGCGSGFPGASSSPESAPMRAICFWKCAWRAIKSASSVCQMSESAREMRSSAMPASAGPT